MIIAIDGPAGSGKSTVAKIVAQRLGYQYIDSGAMYRAVTHAWLEQKFSNPQTCSSGITEQEYDEQILNEILMDFDFAFDKEKVFLHAKDISEAIRQNIISQNVSYIASFAIVRTALVALQRQLASKQSVVMDGRDIATVVFPDAESKIFLTASAEVRARRREKELSQKGESLDFDKLLEEIKQRDHLDSTREISPLKKASDAVEISTDDLSIDEVVEKILCLKAKV